MQDTRPPIPPGVELVRLRTVIKYTLETIAATEVYCETAADVVRRVDAAYAEKLDDLRRELQAAQEAMRTGSPAAIQFALDTLLEVTTP